MSPDYYIHRGTILTTRTVTRRANAMAQRASLLERMHSTATMVWTDLRSSINEHCDIHGDDDKALSRKDAIERRTMTNRLHITEARMASAAANIEAAKRYRDAFTPTSHVIPYVPAKASKVWARGTSPRRQDKAVMRWCLSRIANGVATLTDAEAKRYGVKPGLKVRVCSDGLYTLDIPFDKVAGRCTNLSAAMAKRLGI